MGQRTSSETLAAIIVAFWKQPTWSQADLSRHAGVTPRSMKRHLDDLTAAGWPLEREEDHPHVYWSVPKGWFPGGVMLENDGVAALIHLLVRSPASAERTRVLRALTGLAPALLKETLERVVPPRSSELEEQLLPVVLDAVAERVALRLRYVPTSSGMHTERVVSVQRVLVGPPTRFVAWCHTQKALRWFRLDSTTTISRDSVAFNDVDDAEVDAVLNASVDGFHGQQRVTVSFFVSLPDARWVANNLPEGLAGVSVEGGLLVEAETAGLLPIARFVVGLGAAAECRSAELAALVRELPEGALRGRPQE